MYRTYFAKFLADKTGELALLTTTLSVVSVLVAIASYFYFKPRMVFDKHRQVYKNEKEPGVYYCVSCKDGHNRWSKLRKKEHGWICFVKECRTVHHDPDNMQKNNTSSFYIPD